MDTLIFGIIALVTFVCIIGSYVKLMMTYTKFRKIDNISRLSGVEVAEKILSSNSLDKVYVIEVKGELIDHYDAARNVIRLSTNVFHGTSIASMVIAAHESALAIQNKKKSLMLKMRNLLLPTINIITYLSYIGLLLAIISTSFRYLKMAIGVMFIIVLFHILTYGIEKKASIRGNLELKKLQLVKKNELKEIEEMASATSLINMALPISLIYNLLFKIFKRRDS